MARDSKRATEEMGLDGGGERVGGGGFEHLNWHPPPPLGVARKDHLVWREQVNQRI